MQLDKEKVNTFESLSAEGLSYARCARQHNEHMAIVLYRQHNEHIAMHSSGHITNQISHSQ